MAEQGVDVRRRCRTERGHRSDRLGDKGFDEGETSYVCILPRFPFVVVLQFNIVLHTSSRWLPHRIAQSCETRNALSFLHISTRFFFATRRRHLSILQSTREYARSPLGNNPGERFAIFTRSIQDDPLHPRAGESFATCAGDPVNRSLARTQLTRDPKQNRQGKTRLSKWYVPFEDDEKVRIRGEVHRMIAPRDQKYQSNFVEVRHSPHPLPIAVVQDYLRIVSCIDGRDMKENG